MSKMGALFLAGLACCAGSPPNEAPQPQANHERVTFIVTYEAHLGLHFESETQQFVVARFDDQMEFSEMQRAWEERTEGALYVKGLDLFCDCTGRYFVRDGHTWFQVAEARFYFDRFTDWNSTRP